MTDTRLVNLIVPGAANLQHLARALHELDALNYFYYSHAWRTTPASISLPAERAINLWSKEYLTRGHLMAIGWRYADTMFPVYHKIFERGVLKYWHSAPVVHALLWGATRRVLARTKREGGTTLGLIANSHPEQLAQLMATEANRIGLPADRTIRQRDRNILEEVALCDHLHAESEFTKKSYIARGFSADRIHVIRPGKDLTRFYPTTEAERPDVNGTFRVLCVGAVSLRKGQVHLLEAWRRLALPDAELTLIGAMNAEIEPYVRPYADLFKHIGRAPELRPHFVRSAVMVIPSIEDGHAHVVGEALACGIPVITTINTGAADYITAGVNGYVVPVASPEAIADKLLELYRDRARLRAMQDAARGTISIVGSWMDRARDFADLYRRIAPKQQTATESIRAAPLVHNADLR